MPTKSSVPPAAQPKHSAYFDAWNSSSTGHQRAENRLGGSTGWRQSRSMKLSHQFKSGGTGGKRISDTVGAGSEDWDENAKALIPRDVRERAKISVGDMLASQGTSGSLSAEEKLMALRKHEDVQKEDNKSNREKGVFDGLVIYINGITHPLISDHKLKHLLVENGARLSIHLGRRQVTHVILGRPSGTQGLGAGGGLAGTKIEKEIKRVGGAGIKYIGVEWYVQDFPRSYEQKLTGCRALESLKAGRRLPETQFSNLKVAAKRQNSVYDMFKTASST
ncbi:hypothetical protein LARI1_G000400 [Lachnellula arida]|uniref:BRCT domain-containing protein n=1 Tax=Lachnellula arida TaxID=1316785 RepID=A0A8T9BNP9_9HELO|nr:hypothetical protein LARI1_G000400 [Lachnellula arida]